MTKKSRESNFELLRILAMFMIVFLHLGTHGIQTYGEVSELLSGANEFIYYFIRALAIVAINVYVLISGYFLTYSTFKWRSLARLFFTTSVFSAVIYIVSIGSGDAAFSGGELLEAFLSVFRGEYWFVTMYFSLYCFFPFLNKLAGSLSKKEHRQLLSVSFFMLSLWPFLFENDVLHVNRGFSLIFFMFLYLSASYIRRHGALFKDFSKYVYLGAYILGALVIGLVFYRSDATWVSQIYQYSSPLVLIMSYCLFMFFKRIRLRSRSINNIATYAFGIYLIHEHPIVRGVLWEEFGIVENILDSSDQLVILKMLGYTISLFVIFWIGSFILNHFYHLLETGSQKIVKSMG